MLQAELKVIGGKQAGKVIPLTTQKFLIGREQDCHLRPNSELVSRHHCVFTLDDFSLRLRDLGSTNGTLVNGERLRGQVVLKAGDRVHIGKLDFEILLREPAAVGTEPSPAPATTDAPGDPQEASVSAETTELAAADTSFDIPAVPPEGDAGGAATSDTTIIMKELPELTEQPAAPEASEETAAPQPPEEAAAPQAPEPPSAAQPPAPLMPQQPAPVYPQQPMPGYPQPPAPYPPQVPYQPMPAPYPGGMQYPGQPMYPQQPMAYPPQPVAYPPQPEPAPQQPVPMEEAPAAEADDGTAAAPTWHLPPPEETGVAPAQPPAGQEGDQEAGKPAEEENPSTRAADIIKQYMQRRPDVG